MTAVTVIEARAEGSYWVAQVQQPWGDTYLIRTFRVIDADLVPLATIAAVAKDGAASAGDRWCRECGNRLRHDWRIIEGVLRAVCGHGHEYVRAAGEPPPMMVDNDIMG